MTGTLGNLPLPVTLKYPAWTQSMTGVFDLSFKYFSLDYSESKVQSLSILMAGQ